MKTGLLWQCMILFFSLHTAAVAELSCHIHPPTTTGQPDKKIKLAGPYRNQNECNKENERLYSLKGRCHCSFTQQFRLFNDSELNSRPGTNAIDNLVLP